MNDLAEMRAFVATARAGSLTAAARGLGVATSMISERLRQLETRLAVKLLVRSTRRQSLTPAGEAYLARCEEILQLIERAELEAHADRDGHSGTLRVACPVPLGRHVVGPLAARFMALHPDVRIDLQMSRAAVDLIGNAIDIAVRGGIAPHPSFISRPLFSSPRILVASPGYLQQHGTPRSVAELALHRCIDHGGSGGATEPPAWMLGAGEHRQRVGLHVVARANDPDTMIQWALAGVGVMQRSRWEVAALLDTGRLVEVLPETAGEPRLFAETHLVKSIYSRRIALFVDYLHAELPAHVRAYEERGAAPHHRSQQAVPAAHPLLAPGGIIETI